MHHCQLYKYVIDKIRVASVLIKEPRYPELWGKEEQLGYMWNYEVSFMPLILKNQA